MTKINAENHSIPSLGASRRQVLAGGLALAGVLATANGPASAEGFAGEKADFLFVQTAREMSFADGTLTLKNVSPVTLFFTDRPERIAGNMSTEKFIPFWSEGKDSFLSDPPNADLSILQDGVLKQVVVVLKDPAYDGQDLTYQVTVIDGDIPASARDVSVFIDVIGMPLTPLSVAGVDRRAFRRAVY